MDTKVKKLGRKPKLNINAETLKRIESLAAQGLTEEQVYLSLGISHDTFYRMKKQNAEFSEALKKGKAKGIAVVTNALFQKAKEGNIPAMIFFLKNRDRESWSDNPEAKSKDDILPITVTVAGGSATEPAPS